MNMTFTTEPIPELTMEGGTLAELGFIPGALLQLTFDYQTLRVTVVIDDVLWEVLCEDSQNNGHLGADWVRESGEVVVGGDWLTDIGITDAEHVDITMLPGLIEIQRRPAEIFRA